MGIYDREYYRKEGPNYLDRLIPAGAVCKWLILGNVVIFLLQNVTLTGGSALSGITGWFILDPQKVLDGQVWRLLSYAFLHETGGGFPVHIFFNMLFLWWFGSDLETMYGSREFLGFYLVAAFLGGVAFALHALATQSSAVCLGASGAVTAVMVLYACHFPSHLIYVFFVLPVPIWLFVVFQVAQDAFYFVGPNTTRVAVVVHLAGALFGFVYFKFRLQLSGWLDGWGRWWRQTRSGNRPRLKLYAPEEEKEPVAVAAPRGQDLDEHLEAKLDAVLEKVARHGQASLTDKERQILLKASEIYKRRRS